MSSAFWQFGYWEARSLRHTGRAGGRLTALEQWEAENTSAVRRAARELAAVAGRPANLVLLGLTAFLLGASVVAPGRGVGTTTGELRHRVSELEGALAATRGELEVAGIEMARLQAIAENSARFRIPADLAASIHDIALAEGVDPAIAFSLVRVESGFSERAVSSMGAVGLTQVMPRTAAGLAPGISYHALFDRDTNLRLGFRYLNELLERYQGDLRLALLAYNRGPGTVDAIRRAGGDPGNGYARAVMGHRR